MKKSVHRRWVMVALLALVTCFVLSFGGTYRGAFVWDDVATIQRNTAFDRPIADGLRITQHGHIDPAILKVSGARPSHESYRPLLFLTFASEIRAFGRSSKAMHVTNVVLGALALLAAFDVAVRLLRSRSAALVVVGIFAFHPLQVEPISYVSARADVLSCLLALVAFSAIARGRIVLASLAFLASLFAKEATIGLPLVVGAAAVLVEDRGRYKKGALALVVVLPVYALVRHWATLDAPSALATSSPAIEGVLAVPVAFFQYLYLFLVPLPVSIARPLATANALGWAASVVLLGAGGIYAKRRSLNRPQRLFTLGLVIGVLFLAPAIVVAVIQKVAADRYAYLPVFGFSLATVAIARFGLGRASVPVRRWVRASIPVALIALALVAHVESGNWLDANTLYTHAVESEPESSSAHYGLGLVRAGEGKWSDAKNEFRLALARDPSNVRAKNNLTVAYLRLGMVSDAERNGLETVRLGGETGYRAWFNLAEVFRVQGRIADACGAIDESLALNPDYDKAKVARAACEKAGPH